MELKIFCSDRSWSLVFIQSCFVTANCRLLSWSETVPTSVVRYTFQRRAEAHASLSPCVVVTPSALTSNWLITSAASYQVIHVICLLCSSYLSKLISDILWIFCKLISSCSCSDVALSSDFIAGFCGETEDDHRETVELMRKVKYNFAYCFPYSMRQVNYSHFIYQNLEPKCKYLTSKSFYSSSLNRFYAFS